MDACCVNRLTDDQSQARIRQEAEAVERILKSVGQSISIWISSEVLNEEIESCPLPGRKQENQSLLVLASELIPVNDAIIERARHLQSIGYGAFDAMHLPAPKLVGRMCC